MFFLPYFQGSHFDEPNYRGMQAHSEYASMIEIHFAGSQEEIGPQVRQVLAEHRSQPQHHRDAQLRRAGGSACSIRNA